MIVTGTHVLFHAGSDVFSNWHATPMTAAPAAGLGPVAFANGEQLFMAKKALRFGDDATLGQVLRARTAKDQKAAGRAVTPFDRDAWFAESPALMYETSIQKYGCSPKALDALVRTDRRRLVEASPFDGQWGTGLGERHPRACDPAAWSGLNRLGRVLEMVRRHFTSPAGADAARSLADAAACRMGDAWDAFDADAFADDARPW